MQQKKKIVNEIKFCKDHLPVGCERTKGLRLLISAQVIMGWQNLKGIQGLVP